MDRDSLVYMAKLAEQAERYGKKNKKNIEALNSKKLCIK